MKKTIFFMTALLTMMVFVGCEPPYEPPINDEPYPEMYSKQSYINHSAVVDGVKDPMLNIDWLKKMQNEFDADTDRCIYRALLQFTAVGDSVNSIYEYINYWHANGDEWTTRYSRETAVRVYNLDGSYYDFGNFWSPYDDVFGVTKATGSKIENIIEETLENNVNNRVKIEHAEVTYPLTRKPRPVPPMYVEMVDTMLNNVTDIEILSCYKHETSKE